jgi:putative aminopeptidase FrvX
MNKELSTEHPALPLLRELLAVASPSGREEKMAALVRRKLEEMGYDHETDPAGNVHVRLEGRDAEAPLCVLAAHMDEIGMVVTGIESDGKLRVARSGGLQPHKIGERPLNIIGDEQSIIGVLSLGAGHGLAADKAATWDSARVITGLSPHQLKEAGIRPGSTAVPVIEGRGPYVFGDPADPLIGAWTFDDRMGVLALLLLLQELKERGDKPRRPTIAAFTIHEEGGAHGAKVLAQRERPEFFIAVDGCPITPGSNIVADGRPVAWSKDAKAHYDQRLIRVLARAACDAGTELQIAVLGDGIFSDASAVYDCGAVPRVAIVGHARENSHGFEVARLSVVDNLVQTLHELVGAENWE